MIMIQKLYSKNNDPDVLQHIVDILNDGGIIIYPTDTMYAMGCHALKERVDRTNLQVEEYRSA